MFSLIKLLAVLFVGGLLITAASLLINITRMNSRDAARAADIAAIKQALASYSEGSVMGYPASIGECLREDYGVGAELKDAGAIKVIPVDPLWPLIPPQEISNGMVAGKEKNFCYYYYSGSSNQYKISYFLESDSNSGQAGINTASQ